jgi:hypothetical protein
MQETRNWWDTDAFDLIATVIIIIGAISLLAYGYWIRLSAALLIAATALFISLFLPFFDVAFLERKRRRSELSFNKNALREALYNEIGDIIHTFHQIFADDFLDRIKFIGSNIEVHSVRGDLILLQQLKMKIDRLMRFAVYDYTRSNPTLFYGFGYEARKIDWFYRFIKSGITELDSQIQDAERDLQSQALSAQKDDKAPLAAYEKSMAEFIAALWGIQPKGLQEKALDRTEFLETLEQTYLKKAISQLDRDSLDYLTLFIDPDDRDYFDRWRVETDSCVPLGNAHEDLNEGSSVAPTEVEEDTDTEKDEEASGASRTKK